MDWFTILIWIYFLFMFRWGWQFVNERFTFLNRKGIFFTLIKLFFSYCIGGVYGVFKLIAWIFKFIGI